MLKEGRLTVRFSNLDVSLDGNDARVRCRRAVVANGKIRCRAAPPTCG